jgi:hypothetical protein
MLAQIMPLKEERAVLGEGCDDGADAGALHARLPVDYCKTTESARETSENPVNLIREYCKVGAH